MPIKFRKAIVNHPILLYNTIHGWYKAAIWVVYLLLYQHYLKYVWHKPELNPYLLSVYLTAQFLIHILCPHNLKTINVNIFNQLSLYPSTDWKGPCAHRNKGLIWMKMNRKPWVLRPHLGPNLGVPEKKGPWNTVQMGLDTHMSRLSGIRNQGSP